VAFRRGSVSPHSGGTVPDLHRVPLPLAYRREPIILAMTLSRRFALWGPVVIWAAVIFGLSSIPVLSTGLGTWDEILRKGAHVAEYAVLGALLLRAFRRELPALALGLLYAASDELHQHFVRGRHPSPFDLAFDACGLALGLLLFLFVQSERARA
jgi:VanZ family protein